MKRIYVFALFFCCLLLTTMGEMTVNEREEIDLCDKHIKKKQKSLIKPVQAFISCRSVEVNFNTALGIIDISVYDETGNTVYWQSVNAYAGLQVFIDIASFDEGWYTIEFVDSQGKYLSGDFEIL